MIAIMLKSINRQLEEIAGSEQAFGERQFLFHRGDSITAIYLILEGSVHLTRHQSDGATLILQRAEAGSILAEASLFAARYHCGAMAVSATRVRSVPKRAIRSRMIESPEFAEAWIAHLSHEIQKARHRAEILSLKTVSARLDAWTDWQDGILPAKGEWRSVAAEIGASPEALYRELAKRRSR